MTGTPEGPKRPATVRPAEPGDLEAVVAIERTSYSTPWTPRTFEGLLGHPSTLFRVVELEEAGEDGGAGGAGAVVAYGVLWWAADEGELANLAVAPAARGHGVGRRLLDALLAEAAVRGVRRVFLEVRASNEAALALYRSRGFEQMGVRRSYYRAPREDARVMRLELDPESR